MKDIDVVDCHVYTLFIPLAHRNPIGRIAKHPRPPAVSSLDEINVLPLNQNPSARPRATAYTRHARSNAKQLTGLALILLSSAAPLFWRFDECLA